MRQIAPSRVRATDLRPRDRFFLWPFFETRLFWAALSRYWRRILVGALVGWVVAVVGGAVILAALESQGVSRSTSDGLGIAIVFGGTAFGALTAYALRPAPPVDEATRPSAKRAPNPSEASRRARALSALRVANHRLRTSTRSLIPREAPRPREIGEATRRRRRSRAANR
jgi:hypothetical protein